jgi:hypothetical protein
MQPHVGILRFRRMVEKHGNLMLWFNEQAQKGIKPRFLAEKFIVQYALSTTLTPSIQGIRLVAKSPPVMVFTSVRDKPGQEPKKNVNRKQEEKDD